MLSNIKKLIIFLSIPFCYLECKLNNENITGNTTHNNFKNNSIKLLNSYFMGLGSYPEQASKQLCRFKNKDFVASDYTGLLTILKNKTNKKKVFGSIDNMLDPFFSSGVAIGPVEIDTMKVAICSDDTNITVFDFNNDSPFLWQQKLLTPAFNEPICHYTHLYVQDILQNVYAFDQYDGTPIWQLNLMDLLPDNLLPFYGGFRSNFVPFVINDEYLLVLDCFGRLNLLKQFNGELLDNSVLFVNKNTINIVDNTISGLAKMQGDNELLFIATTYGMSCIDRVVIGENEKINLTEYWVNNDPIWFDFILYKEFLCYTTMDGDIVLLSKRTGKEIWRKKLLDDLKHSLGEPTLYHRKGNGDPYILVSSTNGQIYAIELNSGNIIKNSKLPIRSEVTEKIIIENDTDDIFWILDKNGKLNELEWNFEDNEDNLE